MRDGAFNEPHSSVREIQIRGAEIQERQCESAYETTRAPGIRRALVVGYP